MDSLLAAMQAWSEGTPLEQRAAAAALCEPKLLRETKHVKAVLRILDEITASFEQVDHRRSEDFRTLRKGMGYCWSVAVVAAPDEGKALMEKWLEAKDKDIKWIMRENLKKKRLARMDSKWVEKCLGSQGTA